MEFVISIILIALFWRIFVVAIAAMLPLLGVVAIVLYLTAANDSDIGHWRDGTTAPVRYATIEEVMAIPPPVRSPNH